MSPRVGLTAGIPDHFTIPGEFLELAEWIDEMGQALGECGYIADPEIHEITDVRSSGEGQRIRESEGAPSSDGRLRGMGAPGSEGLIFQLHSDDDGHHHVLRPDSGSGSCWRGGVPLHAVGSVVVHRGVLHSSQQ